MPAPRRHDLNDSWVEILLCTFMLSACLVIIGCSTGEIVLRTTPPEPQRAPTTDTAKPDTTHLALAVERVLPGMALPASALALPQDPAQRRQHLTVLTATLALRAARDLDRWAPCHRDAHEACARQVAASVGARALGRPLDEDEIQTLMNAFHLAGGDEDFAAGVQMIILSVLQSPHVIAVSPERVAWMEPRILMR